MFTFKKNKTAIFLIIAVLFLILDRFLKFLSIKGFYDEPVFLIKEFFSLNFAPNYYIAFSLPLSGKFLIISILLMVLTLIYYLLFLIKKQRSAEYASLFFVVLGSISNLAYRMNYGYVVDYLELKYFTIFNIADAMIVLGFISLVALLYFKGDLKS
ncbi:signal peptidase II [bacterium]|nr:signal peptidase II [bacterium]